ncbi:MAG: prepilin-type N-terminal cleavage/methylation domain-containing protein [Lachnospiraceae bacterium]|nr:prepilin-type N-terminal cleavage/methylation domain-containing protein [Lachnospiraceae bacterium]
MDNMKLKNAGFSLVELIVTMAIASILVGGVSFSVSLAFSKDAARCATILNDTLSSVRMDSMSRPGDYTVEIKDENDGGSPSKYVAVVTCKEDRPGEEPLDIIPPETIYLEGDAGENRIKTITATLESSGSSIPLMDASSHSVKISFDKSKGYVKTGAGTDIPDEGIIVFHIEPVRGSREEDVSLITSTGKHTIGTY